MSKTKTIEEQDEELLGLLWADLRRDPDHRERRQTGFGTKTKTGLVASVRRIIEGDAHLVRKRKDAMDWALGLAYDDQQHYLRTGNAVSDYGKEWAEVGRQKAAHCKVLAEMTGQVRWAMLAQQLRDSADMTEEEEANG